MTCRKISTSKILLITFLLLTSSFLSFFYSFRIDGIILINESFSSDDFRFITNVEDLQNISSDLDANYVLSNNIDASSTKQWNNGHGFYPIGTEADPFNGSLDGRGNSITGLTISKQNIKNCGLFGSTTTNATIRNLNMRNAFITGSDVGGIVGHHYGNIFQCSFSGIINSEGMFAGGLVGINSGSVSRSWVDCDLTGPHHLNKMGGLVGSNCGLIADSHFSGNISVYQESTVLIGEDRGTLSNCHYNYDKVLSYGKHPITRGCLFKEQYTDWISHDLRLSISDYLSTLNPKEDFYEINGIKGLNYLLGFSEEIDLKFRLIADIDMSGDQDFFIPYFSACEFDGGNHFISGLSLNFTRQANIGFFGIVNGTNIHNLNIIDSDVRSLEHNVGILIGQKLNGQIVNCSTNGFVSGSLVGGLIGSNNGFIRNSRSFAHVEKSYTTSGIVETDKGYKLVRYDSAGGLVGINQGIIIDSFTNVSVNGSGYIGGIAGTNEGLISHSSSSDTLRGIDVVGGIAGSNIGIINNKSYSQSIIFSKGFAGGIVGINEYYPKTGLIESTYFEGEITGERCVGGIVGIDSTSTISWTENPNHIINSHYNVEGTLINGTIILSIGGLYEEQYRDWFENGMRLDIKNYTSSLIPVGDSFYIRNGQGLKDLLGFCDIDDIKLRLGCDIDLSEYEGLFIPYFSGEFDGNYHTITNINFNGSVFRHGFFGLNNGGIIKNLIVKNATLKGLVVGGLVGENNNGTITNSSFSGEIIGDYIGGITAINYGSIDGSFSKIDIVTKTQSGGFVGINEGSINNSYALGKIKGDHKLGGFVGINHGMINNSYSIVTITKLDGQDAYFVGENYIGFNPGFIHNSFFQNPKEYNSYDNGIPKTMEEMKLKNTFFKVGWDFTAIWDIIENESYPFLRWLDFEPSSYEPISVAGGNITIDEDGPITLDGSESHGFYGIVNYTWRFKDGGKDIVLYGVSPNYIFHDPGVYIETLTVTDRAGLSDSTSIHIVVRDITPPHAIAGPDVIVKKGSLIYLDGGESSDNGGIVNYTWIFIENDIEKRLYGVNVTHVFGILGKTVVTLSVTDGGGNTDIDQINITVIENHKDKSIILLLTIAIIIIVTIVMSGILLMRLRQTDHEE